MIPAFCIAMFEKESTLNKLLHSSCLIFDRAFNHQRFDSLKYSAALAITCDVR